MPLAFIPLTIIGMPINNLQLFWVTPSFVALVPAIYAAFIHWGSREHGSSYGRSLRCQLSTLPTSPWWYSGCSRSARTVQTAPDRKPRLPSKAAVPVKVAVRAKLAVEGGRFEPFKKISSQPSVSG